MHPYSSIDMTAALKKLCFILSVRTNFHLIESLSIAVHAFISCESMSFSVDEMLLIPNYAVVFQLGWVYSPVTLCHWHCRHGLPKETMAAITILNRNAKVKVCSPDGDTEYFDIAAGVLQGDTLAPYLFIICLDYMLRTAIDKIRENGFKLTKKRSRRYSAKTIKSYKSLKFYLIDCSQSVNAYAFLTDWFQ